jgi:alpha-N-arabinofuranosidase
MSAAARPRNCASGWSTATSPAARTLSDRRRANGQPDPFKITYWGVGNENWGCGGRFTPEDYAAEYRRFSTYLRDLGGHPLFLIACGPSGNDVQWTRRFFEKLSEPRACARIHGFAAHYYCGTAGTATDYTDEQWYELLEKACRMEAMVVQQRADHGRLRSAPQDRPDRR